MTRQSVKVVAMAGVAGWLALAPACAFAQVSTFTGGDPDEGLDLQGSFAPGYAVYAGPASETGTYTIQDAVFENALVAGGIDITAGQETPFREPGVVDPENSANDLNLQEITDFVRFGGNGAPVGTVGVAIDAPVIAGTQYKLQLLFNEPGNTGRGFDVAVEGVIVADEFSPGNSTAGALITHTFTATDSNLDVDLLVADGFGDDNAIINAVSLEVIPEPGTASLLGLGLIVVGARRRRNRG